MDICDKENADKFVKIFGKMNGSGFQPDKKAKRREGFVHCIGSSFVCCRKVRVPKMGVFGYFGGTKNGTLGAWIKILRPLFNTNTPLKPPFRHFGNHFGPRKSDFWPFYWFWSFSHWNSHWSRKILRTAEGRVVHQKQKLFWKSETKWNNLKPCRSWRNKIFWIRITLLYNKHPAIYLTFPLCSFLKKTSQELRMLSRSLSVY